MEPIYEINWEKYRNLCFSKVCGIEGELKKTFHNCHYLMERKKKLETMVRSYNGSFKLTKHFKTDYKKRKQFFYRKIIDEILKEDNEKEKEICELIKDILFIYSKKQEELEYVLDLVNSMEAEISHREEMRESMMEDFRGCD